MPTVSRVWLNETLTKDQAFDLAGRVINYSLRGNTREELATHEMINASPKKLLDLVRQLRTEAVPDSQVQNYDEWSANSPAGPGSLYWYILTELMWRYQPVAANWVVEAAMNDPTVKKGVIT